MTSSLTVVKTRAELTSALRELDVTRPGTRGVVMTMGALHEGHLDLVRAARQESEQVIVTIFVNPAQFAPGEDLAAYPRDLAGDVERLAELGVDVVFAPSEKEIYPQPPMITYDPGTTGRIFEGATRPTHFAGMLQVVTIFLHLLQPDLAFFGQKDAQQLALVRLLVRDLAIPVDIRMVEIRREADGLAMSSRNAYLNVQERQEALALSQALAAGKDAHARGASYTEIREVTTESMLSAPGVRLDYVTVVDADSFQELSVELPSDRALLAVAAWVGKTRLIDNVLLG